MEIEKKLKEARANAGLTQEQVAERIMVSRQTISNWENGKSLPDIISIMKLSDLYQISLDELLKGDSKMKEKIEKDVKIANGNKYVLQQQNPFRRIIMFDFVEKMQKLKINIDRERFSCYDIIEKREYYVY